MMNWNKKGAELSINIIIIAVLALVVLVILFAVFTGRLGKFSQGLENCGNLGGTCMSSNECDAAKYRQYRAGKTNCEEQPTTPLCCLPIPGA